MSEAGIPERRNQIVVVDPAGFLQDKIEDTALVQATVGYLYGQPDLLIEKFGSLSGLARQRVMNSMFDLSVKQLRSGMVSAREFSIQFQRVMDLDEGEDNFPRTLSWLKEVQESDEGNDRLVARALPVELMTKKLEMADLTFCSPAKAATYVAFLCNKVAHAGMVNRKHIDKPAANEALGERTTLFTNKLIQALDELGIRMEENEEDDGFLHDLYRGLMANKHRRVSDYVIEVLESVVERRGNDVAQRILAMIQGDGSEWEGETRSSRWRDDDE